MLEPILVTYLSESESHDENTGSDTTSKESSKLSGLAVKISTDEWKIHLDNKILMTAMDKDLLNGHKFYIKQKWMANNNDDIKKETRCKKEKSM